MLKSPCLIRHGVKPDFCPGAHGSMRTGVPTATDLKNASAMKGGMRMQPCEAG